MKTRILSQQRIIVVSSATVGTILAVLFVAQDVAKQPVLITSLASSSFLLYYQPLNEINRFRPLVFSHVISSLIGYIASLIFPVPYISAAVCITLSVIAMLAFRIVHPPAVSTSLVFSYRPHEATALLTFFLTLMVVVILAFIYLFMHRIIRPGRFAGHFGLNDNPPGRK